MKAEERIYPDNIDPRVYHEHLARYKFAGRFVTGKKVLDMACGTGYGSKLLFEVGATEVYGGDTSKEAVDYAIKNYAEKSIKFQIMDATKITFPDKSFDCIISFETIEHVSSYLEMIKEFHRILRDDGIIIISTPNKEVVSGDREQPTNPFHVKEFTKNELLSILNNYFTDIELFSQRLLIHIEMKKDILRKIILAVIKFDILDIHKKFKNKSAYKILGDYITNISKEFEPLPYVHDHKPLVFIAKGKKRSLNS